MTVHGPRVGDGNNATQWVDAETGGDCNLDDYFAGPPLDDVPHTLAGCAAWLCAQDGALTISNRDGIVGGTHRCMFLAAHLPPRGVPIILPGTGHDATIVLGEAELALARERGDGALDRLAGAKARQLIGMLALMYVQHEGLVRPAEVKA